MRGVLLSFGIIAVQLLAVREDQVHGTCDSRARLWTCFFEMKLGTFWDPNFVVIVSPRVRVPRGLSEVGLWLAVLHARAHASC